jgi:hypothetical protein
VKNKREANGWLKGFMATEVVLPVALLQGTYNTDLAKAQGGDKDALSVITKDADALLQAAKAFYASSSGYADIYNTVVGQLSKFESGGRVMGGTPGVDSVPIMAQQDEYIVRADAARRNMPLLEAINAGAVARGFANGGQVRSFSGPVVATAAANDNSAIEALGEKLARTMVATMTAQIESNRDEIGALRNEVRRLNDTTRIEASRAPRPGTHNKAA